MPPPGEAPSGSSSKKQQQSGVRRLVAAAVPPKWSLPLLAAKPAKLPKPGKAAKPAKVVPRSVAPRPGAPRPVAPVPLAVVDALPAGGGGQWQRNAAAGGLDKGCALPVGGAGGGGAGGGGGGLSPSGPSDAVAVVAAAGDAAGAHTHKSMGGLRIAAPPPSPAAAAATEATEATLTEEDAAVQRYLVDFEELVQDRDAAAAAAAAAARKKERGKADEAEEEAEAGVVVAGACEHRTEVWAEVGEVCALCGLLTRSERELPAEFWVPVRRARPAAADREPWVGDLAVGSSSEDEGDEGKEQAAAATAAAAAAAAAEASARARRGLDTIPRDMADRMHPHQVLGFHFLWRNLGGQPGTGAGAGGCILAHSPGSGKSYLVICFLKSYMAAHPDARPLIVAPKSMLGVWEREFRKWGVGVPCVTLSSSTARAAGAATAADAAFRGRFPASAGARRHVDRYAVLQRWKRAPSVLVMNYQSLQRLVDEPAGGGGLARENRALVLRRTDVLVVDEGHNIRNKGTQRRAILQFRTRSRILLSGTLFQNNVEELRNLCYMVRPDCLRQAGEEDGEEVVGGWGGKGGGGGQSGDEVAERAREVERLKQLEMAFDRRCRELFPRLFRKEAASANAGAGEAAAAAAAAKDEEIKRWQQLTDPFADYFDGKELARRMPPFYEYVVLVNPYPEQRRLLAAYAAEGRPATDLEAHLRIGHICIHPVLHTTTTGSLQQSHQQQREAYASAAPEDGVKLDLVLKMVAQFVGIREKVLVFCVHVEPLQLLRRVMEARLGWAVMRDMAMVYGKMDAAERLAHMDAFNDPGGGVKVMLASTRACGEGVSMVGASRVIHLGAEWNPSVNKQANCRAYRWGQKREVHVYRLLARGTIEEDKYGTSVCKDQLGKRILVPASQRQNQQIQQQQQQQLLLTSETTTTPMPATATATTTTPASTLDPVLERLTARDSARSIARILRRLEQPGGASADASEHQLIYDAVDDADQDDGHPLGHPLAGRPVIGLAPTRRPRGRPRKQAAATAGSGPVPVAAPKKKKPEDKRRRRQQQQLVRVSAPPSPSPALLPPPPPPPPPPPRTPGGGGRQVVPVAGSRERVHVSSNSKRRASSSPVAAASPGGLSATSPPPVASGKSSTCPASPITIRVTTPPVTMKMCGGSRGLSSSSGSSRIAKT